MFQTWLQEVETLERPRPLSFADIRQQLLPTRSVCMARLMTVDAATPDPIPVSSAPPATMPGCLDSLTYVN